MIRRLLIGALATVFLVVAVGRIRRALASDEQTLRWALEELVENVDSGNVGKVGSFFHADFHDESSGARYDDVQRALRGLYFRERDPVTRAFRLRLELPEELLDLQVEEGSGRAEVDATARIYALVNGEKRPWWDARAHIILVQVNGRWRILRTSRVNHSERVGALLGPASHLVGEDA
ncbi:MAG: hypothetical protein ACI8QC_001633 [Planctomycetota bacterium]|jgi:hypothetical protein